MSVAGVEVENTAISGHLPKNLWTMLLLHFTCLKNFKFCTDCPFVKAGHGPQLWHVP